MARIGVVMLAIVALLVGLALIYVAAVLPAQVREKAPILPFFTAEVLAPAAACRSRS